jgi:hypothetical protein
MPGKCTDPTQLRHTAPEAGLLQLAPECAGLPTMRYIAEIERILERVRVLACGMSFVLCRGSVYGRKDKQLPQYLCMFTQLHIFRFPCRGLFRSSQWVMRPLSVVGWHRHSRGACCLHTRGGKNRVELGTEVYGRGCDSIIQNLRNV